MLLGEHAVVYGHPCIVTAVDQRLRVSIEKIGSGQVVIDAPQVTNTRFVDEALASYAQKFHRKPSGIKIFTQSSFSGVYGFGSSSAVTVATIKALAEYYRQVLSPQDLFDLSYKTIVAVQGVGSGFDVAAASFGGTLYYRKGAVELEQLTGHVTEFSLVVGYSGVKSNSVAIVNDVAQKRQKYPDKVNKVFVAIEKLVLQAKNAMKNGDWEAVGKYMNFNQEYLRDLGVSTQKLENLISVAVKARAYGAKLSGAGGGDCMVALVSAHTKGAVEGAIKKAGGEVVSVAVNASGARLETTDDQKELFIVVDRNDNVLGYKTRYECHHDKNFIHRTVGVLVFDRKGNILLQKRSLSKDTDPGKWGISCAGHVQKGQTYEEAAQREMEEELGIKKSFRKVKKFISADTIETQMAMLYKTQADGPFKPNPQEVERVEFFDVRQLPKRLASKEIVLSECAQLTLKEAGILP